MMLAGPELRTVPVTIHIPLREVPEALTTELIVATARITAADLESRFGIAKPRLAVAGLNPHAGEGGAMGAEDERIIRPAIEQAEGGGHRRFRAAAGRHAVPRPRPRRLRRGAVHVSRSGADPG